MNLYITCLGRGLPEERERGEGLSEGLSGGRGGASVRGWEGKG